MYCEEHDFIFIVIHKLIYSPLSIDFNIIATIYIKSLFSKTGSSAKTTKIHIYTLVHHFLKSIEIGLVKQCELNKRKTPILNYIETKLLPAL